MQCSEGLSQALQKNFFNQSVLMNIFCHRHHFIVAVHVTGCDLPDSELSAEGGKERRRKKLNLNPRPLNHEALTLPLCYNHCPSVVS